MRSPHNSNAASGESGAATTGFLDSSNAAVDNINADELQARLNSEIVGARAVERLTADLSLLADWRDALVVQIKRAELLLELGLLSADSQDRLARRVRLWCEAADALAASIPGSLVNVHDADLFVPDDERKDAA